MNRVCLVVCIFGLLLSVGCGRGVYTSPIETPLETPAAQVAPATDTAEVATFRVGDVQTLMIVDETDEGRFVATYPQFGNAGVDAVVKAKVDEIYSQGKALIDDPDFAGQKVSVEVKYDIVNETDGVDILFTIDSNVEGAEHPNEVVETLVVDETGRVLPPEELLNGADFDVLLTKAEDKIKADNPEFARLDMHSYVKPEISSFRHVVRNDKGGLTVYFDSELLPHVDGVVFVDL